MPYPKRLTKWRTRNLSEQERLSKEMVLHQKRNIYFGSKLGQLQNVHNKTTSELQYIKMDQSLSRRDKNMSLDLTSTLKNTKSK